MTKFLGLVAKAAGLIVATSLLLVASAVATGVAFGLAAIALSWFF